MHLRNKTISISVFTAVLLGSLAFGQSSGQQPGYQPGQQGKVDGGVIQPLDSSAQPQNSQTQANPPAGQQGKVDGGVIQPIEDQPQPAQAATPPKPTPAQGQATGGIIQPLDSAGQSGGPSSASGIQPIDDGQPVNWAHHEPPPTQPETAPAVANATVPNSPNQPSDTVKVKTPANKGAAESTANGGYLFRAQVEEVRLNATVVDERGRLITNLDQGAFTVFENGQPQVIKHFQHEDIPVALGIVIDNSGSMRDKRPAVNKAAVNLVKASNAQDEVFVVNFNDDYYLDQDYTDSVPKLKEALERYETRGGTALYDAVLASNDHLLKAPKLEKRVLFVVTDGEDDASLNTLEQTIRKVQKENGPTIYTIGILDEQGSHKRRAQRALREMAESTGGVAFFPASLDEVDRITQQIAHDIRNQYTLMYTPTDPQSRGGYRAVKVEARARGYNKLQVRTRSGYYAGQQQNSTPTKTASQQQQKPNASAVR